MSTKKTYSAGILLYRHGILGLEILLGHMGGPFWKNKEEGAWTIPKGEFDPFTESAEEAARREMAEETGMWLDDPLTPLPVLEGDKKNFHFFKLEKTVHTEKLFSNTFEIEWPPRSGKKQEFPELDRFAWFNLMDAGVKLAKNQRRVLEWIGG